jgi:hypothetical protein
LLVPFTPRVWTRSPTRGSRRPRRTPG